MEFPKWMLNLETNEIFPEFYAYGGRSRSDQSWLKTKLSRLSRHNRMVVCLEYREWYLSSGRDKANQRLLEFVSEHGLTLIEVEEAKKQHSGKQKAIFEKLEELKKLKPKARSKYGEIFRN